MDVPMKCLEECLALSRTSENVGYDHLTNLHRLGWVSISLKSSKALRGSSVSPMSGLRQSLSLKPLWHLLINLEPLDQMETVKLYVGKRKRKKKEKKMLGIIQAPGRVQSIEDTTTKEKLNVLM